MPAAASHEDLYNSSADNMSYHQHQTSYPAATILTRDRAVANIPDCASSWSSSSCSCLDGYSHLMRFDPLVSTGSVTASTNIGGQMASDACKPGNTVNYDCVSSTDKQATQTVTNAKEQHQQMQRQTQNQKQATRSALMNQRRSSLNKLKASSLGGQYGNGTQQQQQHHGGLINASFSQFVDEDGQPNQKHNSTNNHRQNRLSHRLGSSLKQQTSCLRKTDSGNNYNLSQINMPLDNEYHKQPHYYSTSTSCYHLDADDEIEPIMLIHDDDNDDEFLFDRHKTSSVQDKKTSNQAPPVFLRGRSSLSMATSKRRPSSTLSPLAKAGTSASRVESIASNVISPSASNSSLGSSEVSSEGEAEEEDDFMTINFAPHAQLVDDDNAQDLQQYLTIDELKHSLNSCWLCGCNWQQDHISLDCCECGGYALTRPCPQCDGACKQVWTRNINATHDHHKALWLGDCGFNKCNKGKELREESSSELPTDSATMK